MIRKVVREIEKLEQQKQKKEETRNQLNAEISEIDSRLKRLIDIKKQYEKLDTNAADIFKQMNSSKKEEEES